MSMDYKGRKLIGLRHALRGIQQVFRKERNLKIHLIISVVVIFFAAFLDVSLMEWAVLFGIIALVISLEMINSSIERVMDYLAPEWHASVGEIKDIAAGAVLVAAISSIIIGCIIFLPKLMDIMF
ncbi:diacylglycerol kinase family protein [Halobacillus sp. A1]|uniref:diacylglycerol kinase family protein n=1 Tax=Halobacillus sp. A1 TaxID=2880262 RepID=UPI0020A672E3|nr:diacylglycerol kinase family protein [Halobacillus sp. A1]MCP3030350.1 diacylglycerol kinase family protein [Halobacillus sp. A1]